ncbi:hypothetical protein Z969_10415 [Clostridium novyi A str. 4570]|uniref:Initiator Rep protein WH1 domain-containing protein n=1 Tax=Clostridium novyi A str. 4570 TaxID=1444290 RepID=A0AA88ZIK0_CLONO|nr:replication initiation protein [Clostridium novyi]KGM99779.1 hypothetical protein Z969_10415 [Clostridium novyi A str. 4570]
MINEFDEKKILMKNNILVQAKYNLTLVENKVFTLLLYNFQKQNNILQCKLPYEAFKEVIKNKNENTIKGITQILQSLQSKKILIQEKKENGENSIWYSYNLIAGFTYDDEFKTFTIDAVAKIYDLLHVYFKTGYTPINLSIILGMNNYYAQRLYDLLRLWSGTKSMINYTVDELKNLLMLEEQYTQYYDFKKRVIAPAIKELNKTGFFEIDFKEIKQGRKVVSIDFFVKDFDTRKYFDINKKSTKLPIKEIDTKLFDGQKEVPVKQSYIDIDAIKEVAIDIEDTFYIPEDNIFNKATLRMFKLDFKDFDFKDSTLYNLFRDAEALTIEKDDIEGLMTVRSYKYFKVVLSNLIEQQGASAHKNQFNDYPQREYNFDELEKKLLGWND